MLYRKIVYILFAIMGTGFGVLTFTMWRQANDIVVHGVKTRGVVFYVVYTQNNAGNSLVSYETESGQSRVAVSMITSDPPPYALGDTVTLWYDPNDSSRVQLDGKDRWSFVTSFGFFSVVLVGLGYGGTFWLWTRERRQRAIEEGINQGNGSLNGY